MRTRFLGYLIAASAIVVVGSGCKLRRNLAATDDVLGVLGSSPEPIYAPALLYTDGEVKTLASEGGKLYLGGRFSHVGPYTRSAPTVNLDSGTILTPSIKFETRVIEPDGNGGYYVAGSSGIYDNSAANQNPGIAHILPDGAVDGSFSARFSGDTITGLKLVGNRLFVVGNFSGVYVGATLNPRGSLAVLDATTGALQAFRYDLSHLYLAYYTVNAPTVVIEHAGNTIYLGGCFGDVDPGGTGTFINLSNTGMGVVIAIDDTSPAAALPPITRTDGHIVDLQVVGSKLYLSGIVSQVNGMGRSGLAALDISTPSAPVLLAEDPLAASSIYSAGTLAAFGSDLYLTGAKASPYPAFVAKVTAGTVVWITPDLGTQSFFPGFLDLSTTRSRNAIAVSPSGDKVYASINNVDYLNGEHVEVRSFDPSTGADTDLSFGNYPRLRVKSGPGEACAVVALATSSVGSTTRLHIGGHFSSIVQERHGLAQIDLESSLPTTWNPDLAIGNAVYSVLAKNGIVYFGGSFSALNTSSTPVSRSNLAAVRATDAGVLSWNPGADGSVSRLHKIGNSLIALGSFGTLGGSTRSRIGIVNATTGALDTSWNPGFVYGGIVNFDGVVRSTVAGNDLYFSTVDNSNSLGGAGTSQAAVYRLSFSDDSHPAITAYWPIDSNGQFNMTTLPDDSGILFTGLITAFNNQMVTTIFDSLVGIKTASLEPVVGAPLLGSNFPLTSSQMQNAMDGMVRRGWVQKGRYYLGGFANNLFGGSSDPWGLAVINLETGTLENPASGSALPTLELVGSSPDEMGIIGDVLTVGNTTYVAGSFAKREMLPGHDQATQTPYILTLKDGSWVEP